LIKSKVSKNSRQKIIKRRLRTEFMIKRNVYENILYIFSIIEEETPNLLKKSLRSCIAHSFKDFIRIDNRCESGKRKAEASSPRKASHFWMNGMLKESLIPKAC